MSHLNPFTAAEIAEIEKIPAHQMQAILTEMVRTAKDELFRAIELITGSPPPFDYMITHESEFSVAFTSPGDHSMAGVWKWSGGAEVRQRGLLNFDGESMSGRIVTDAALIA
jgi:hypothetical protein